MGKIFILPDRVSNRIAAGEVVEQPASVVKELVENSIDAGSESIEVKIEGSGRKLISVSDDGCGMDYDDAIISLERHSTSKIKKPEDLDSISTLGFRGEALASIASVSRLTLLTRMEEQTVGTMVEASGGKLIKVEKAARERGTTVKVEDLFFNTPARLKFLKSDSVEMRRLVRILTNYAIIYKDIKFALFENGRILILVSPSKTLFERIYALSGPEIARSLLPFEGGDGAVRVFGYCSHTNHKRSSRDGLHFFINGRFVDDKLLSGAVASSYKGLIPPGTYPSIFLFIELPFDSVDINVHPTKMEARFKSPAAVRQLIEESIRSALIKSSPVLSVKSAGQRGTGDASLNAETGSDQASGDYAGYLSEGSAAEDILRAETVINGQEGLVHSAKEKPESVFSNDISSGPSETAQNEHKPEPDRYFFRDHKKTRNINRTQNLLMSDLEMESRFVSDLKKIHIRVIGQLLNSFILIQGDDDLLIVDQHIAHERIRYELLKDQFAGNNIESQSLLIPEMFEVSGEDDIALQELSIMLQPLGFQIEPFGEKTWAVKSVPVGMEASAEETVREMLDLFEDIKSSEKKGDLRHRLDDELIALISCHGSIKKNMPLTKEKMEWLLSELALCREPYRCPHGRPVILRIERDELFKKFGRDIH